MEFAVLERHEIRDFGSSGVQIVELLDEGRARVHIARFAPGSVLGRHSGTLWQLFTAVSGAGWVSGEDGVLHTLRPGDSVMWGPGESHESGSDEGMVVVIAQSHERLLPA